MKGPEDWDKGLRELVDAEKGYVRGSRLSRKSQDYIRELVEELHKGNDGGIFVRLPNGSIQFVLFGEDDDVDAMLLELVKVRIKKKRDA